MPGCGQETLVARIGSLADGPPDMTLVERFAELDGWPTSRKTAVMSVLALGLQLTLMAAAYFAFARAQVIDLALFVTVVLSSIPVVLICLAVSLIAMRLNKDARWTAHLLVVLYGGWITVFVQVMGSWSTPYFAFYPLAVIMVALYFGERIGWFAFVYGLCMLIAREVLESGGFLPYAPALLDRSIDSQHNLYWMLGNAIVVMSLFAFCYVIGMLVVATRRLQDRRLHDAHQRLAESIEKLDRSHRLISRYLPRQLAERIVSGEYVDESLPERAKLTIFFSDVEGFTDASDQMDAEDLSQFLNEYLAEMTQIAERYSATINQFVGDGIMIFFGAPQATNDRDHARRAVRMALDMQERMQQLKDAWIDRGVRKPFRARIGINTGYASVGDYGSPGRKVYSAIGIQTNLAARIQAHCEPGKILISDTTWALVREDFVCTDKGEFHFKGLHYPVRIYEVSGSPDHIPASHPAAVAAD